MKTHPNLLSLMILILRRLSAKVSDRIVHLEQLAVKVSPETAVLKTPAQRPKSSKISKKAGIEYTQKVNEIKRCRSARLAGR